MKSPLVSIVLPTYNGERFLIQQLESIYAQSYQDFEIVVSDDASADSTVEILASYADRPNFRYSVNPENMGFIQNFRNALKMAKGRYIAPCDQDDIWLPEKLELLLSAISDHMLVYSDSELADEDGKSLDVSMSETFSVRLISGNNHKAFYYGNCVAGHTSLFRSEMVAYLDTIPEIVFHDHWIAFVASRLGTIHALDKRLVFYRRHNANITSIDSRKKIPMKLLSHMLAKVDRQVKRNQVKLRKLNEFQKFNQRIGQPDNELNEIIEQLNCYNRYFFNMRIFNLLYKNRKKFFAITKKIHLEQHGRSRWVENIFFSFLFSML